MTPVRSVLLRVLLPLAASALLVAAGCGMPADAGGTGGGNTASSGDGGGQGGASDAGVTGGDGAVVTTDGGVGQIDGGPYDGGAPGDGGDWDGGLLDGGSHDGGPYDGGDWDGGVLDGGIWDGGYWDGGLSDGGLVDGGTLPCTTDADCPAGEVCGTQCPVCNNDGGPCPVPPCALVCVPAPNCGTLTCTPDEVCVVAEGGAVLPDGGANVSYSCVPYPAQCQTVAACDCAGLAICGSASQTDCSGPVTVVTCMYP